MTRPRVSPDKRQRTAQACDSCKRRKQKCNGLQPCNTCSKRNLTCTFGASTSDHGSDGQSPPAKRQVVDYASSPPDARSPHSARPSALQSPSAPLQPFPPMRLKAESALPAFPGPALPALQVSHASPREEPSDRRQPPALLGPFPTSSPRPNILHPLSHPHHSASASASSAQLLAIVEKPADSTLGDVDSKDGSSEEPVAYVEANNNYSSRMLQDPTGRLQYVGDSATLSFLQLVRMQIENVSGPSPFTTDPNRHRIVENSFTLPANMRNTHLLPDKETALVLVDSFFVNTSGFVHVVNRRSFMITLESCYSDPLHVEPSWLCLLNLIFAIGLVLATPAPGTRQDDIIRKLRAHPIDRAEMFYISAKGLCDPTTGFEDADFWSVQALLLMTLYTLAVSKRNAAYAYCGMAIRSGFALGLHRPDTLQIFDEERQAIRKHTWRSLYVLDAYLAASLGRPTSISKEDCSPEALKVDPPAFSTILHGPDATQASHLGIDASVRSCQIIGTILKDIYSKRRINTRLAQEIADQCRPWPKNLDPSLHWRQMNQPNNLNASHGIAILHVNLLYCHTVILLTRPFFLHMFNKKIDERSKNNLRPQRFGSRMEKFSESCLLAACHSIVLVQSALDGHYLSPRNPFVVYFLFASALIVLSNAFASLYATPHSEPRILSAISIMSHCASTDPLARRLLFILTAFHDVVKRESLNPRHPYQIPQPSLVASSPDDPISAFLSSTTTSSSIAGSGIDVGMEPGSSFATPGGGISIASLISGRQNASPPGSAPTVHRQSSLDGADSLEGEIDFDTLWRLQGEGGGMAGAGAQGVQGIIDSAVPLFGMSDFRGG